MPHIPLLKIHFNSILPTTPRSAKWCLSLGFPHQNLVYPSSLTHTCYVPRQSHFPWFDPPNNRPAWWTVQIVKLLNMQSSPLPCYLVPLRLIFLLCLFWNTVRGDWYFDTDTGSLYCAVRAESVYISKADRDIWRVNLLKPTGYVMHQQFNIQQLYFLPILYLCVLYLSEKKQRLVPLTA